VVPFKKGEDIGALERKVGGFGRDGEHAMQSLVRRLFC
jgi:hypothetical protein